MDGQGCDSFPSENLYETANKHDVSYASPTHFLYLVFAYFNAFKQFQTTYFEVQGNKKLGIRPWSQLPLSPETSLEQPGKIQRKGVASRGICIKDHQKHIRMRF